MLTFSYLKLLCQVRSLRGQLSSKTRDAIFAVFGEKNLPTVNMSAGLKAIADWKKEQEVANCYKKLFKKMNNILILKQIIN